MHICALFSARYGWWNEQLASDRAFVTALKHIVKANDYYITNEHLVLDDGSTRAAGEVFGYHELTWQYYHRYHLPMMHTETNLAQGPHGDEATTWLWKEWANVLHLRNTGMPIVGFTWYSLTDQVDWDTALGEDNGRVHPVGLYDLDRKIRPLGAAYRRLMHNWRNVLPTQSVCLRVPIVLPDEMDEQWAVRGRAHAT